MWYFILGILIAWVVFLSGCAKKEVPPLISPPSYNQTVIDKPKENVDKEPIGIPAELSKVLSPEKEERDKKDLDYWKKHGRGSAPLLAIFFDFDAFNIRDDMWERIKKNVQYLLTHPEVKVELQGNCDERGTNEYNMALGSKRALEVRRVLIRLGINESRISTISFGEEKPLCRESNEECWSLNRRVDFVIIK